MTTEKLDRRCPRCQRQLEDLEQGRYRCDQHGEWSSYGPKLLVRAPQPEDRKPLRMLLPWETQTA